MKIPSEIKVLIRKRRKLAEDLSVVCSKLDSWMEAQGINMLEHSDYTVTGCMIYCEPDAAERCVIEAIENFESTN